MPSLHPDLFKQLKRTVIEARRAAESGARKTLELLAVHHHEPWGHLTPDQRALRNRLRAHGRQLGDQRDSRRGLQTIDRLQTEFAYQHWHRMLFARFLAEADLLIEPDTGVSISLAECEELARDRGEDWLWLASTYAQKMLPQIFRKGDPVLEAALPLESRSELEELLKRLPRDVFLADDSLGWVYQFWQIERKESINKAEKEIGPDELPAFTQHFTEDYMVAFLLDNSIGAWWAAKHLAELGSAIAGSEQELRQQLSIPGVPLEYLRFVKTTNDNWRPAAGSYEQWPKSFSELRIIDPCCGSGHFLLGAFLMLVPMRVQAENLSARQAVDAVLRENLHGLEIDNRCVELAAFALAFAAWRYPNSGGYRQLPELNLACSGLSIAVAKEEWTRLAVDKHNLRLALDWMHDAFNDASALGSLLNPALSDATKLVQWHELVTSLEQIVLRDETEEQYETAVVAQGLVHAALLLGKKYHLIVTNVPYLARGKQAETMRSFSERNYLIGKNDLATTFLLRCREFTDVGGVCGIVIPQNWLYLGGYEQLRKTLLKKDRILSIAKLGPSAFRDMNWWFANTMLILTQNTVPSDDHSYAAVDVSAPRQPSGKANLLHKIKVELVNQIQQIDNPDSRIGVTNSGGAELLMDYADAYQGLGTSDNPRFVRYFWEQPLTKDWRFLQTAAETRREFEGRQSVLFWQNGGGQYYEHAMLLKREGRLGGWKSGGQAWNKIGIAINVTRNLFPTLYSGAMFDTTVGIIIPKQDSDVLPILSYVSSVEYVNNVKEIDQSLSITEHTLLKVPFDIERWRQEAEQQYSGIVPAPFTTDPAQWIFHGHPVHSDSPLHVAMARLLGYKWPSETDQTIDVSEESKTFITMCDELKPFTDNDGIVCLSSLKGEATAADRLSALLAQAYGDSWSAAKLHALLSAAGCGNLSLTEWLRDAFFSKHCEMFRQQPFVWHIWDGRIDGFHAFCSYHTLAAKDGQGYRCLEKLIYTYLGDWIERQRSDQKVGVEGADARLAAAEHLKKELEKLLAGEPPFDIFVRWKPIHEQPIGWNPDLNDGIRVNIRPFVTATPLGARSSSTCILRTTPKLKWGKDRGKEPARPRDDYPWFWNWNGRSLDFEGEHLFDGNRWNDLHYTNDFKRRAAERRCLALEVTT